MKKKGIEKLDIYQLSMQLGKDVWELVNSWNKKNFEVMGRTYTQTTDSIALNIALGYGRQSPDEKRDYMVYARSAALASKVYLKKAYERGLIKEPLYKTLEDNTELLIGKLYGFVRFLEAEGGAKPPQDFMQEYH